MVSVIIPLYNKEKYIRCCLDSVIEQSYKDIEIIIIDDGSTDGSGQICQEYVKKDRRIQYLKKKNGGESYARNQGLQVAKGDYICFLDADDYYHTNFIKKMYDRCNKDNLDVCVLGNYSIYNNSENISLLEGKEAVELLAQLKFPSSVWAYMYKKVLLKGISFKEDIFFFEDFLFNYFSLLKCKKVGILYEELYTYQINETSLNQLEFGNKQLSELKIIPYIYMNGSYIANNICCVRAHIDLSLLLGMSKSNRLIDDDIQKVKHDLIHLFSERNFIKKIKYMPKKNIITLFSARSSIYFTLWWLRKIYYPVKGWKSEKNYFCK